MSKYTRASWMPDVSASECRSETCLKQFGLLTRRHHCRACGGVFCSGCTTKRRRLAGGIDLERVCDSCAANLDSTEARRLYIRNSAVVAALGLAIMSSDVDTKFTVQTPPALCTVCYGRPIVQDCVLCNTRLCSVCAAEHEERCTKGEGYRVTVVVHELRSAGVHDLTKPSPCVLVSTEHETVRTSTKQSSCSHFYGEEFVLKVTDVTSSIHFKVIDDRTLHYTVIGRACIPLSFVRAKGCRQVWLELLPDDPKERKDFREMQYRSATRAAPMKRPKHVLGWLCVSVVMAFDITCYFQPTVPDYKAEEFNSHDFMLNIQRLQYLWTHKTPTLILITQELSDLVKFGLVIPMWVAVCYGLQVWSAPLLAGCLVIVNGVLASKGTKYHTGFSEVAVYEEDVIKEGVTSKITRAYNAAHELPVVLRKIQNTLGLIASTAERFHTMFSFHDLPVSTTVTLTLLLLATLLSTILYVFPPRMVIFLIGFRVILTDNRPPNPANPLSRFAAVFKSHLRTVLTYLLNLWSHLPDALELEHRAIAAYQLQDGPPSAYHTRRHDSVKS
eukprot:TRINITY_DN6736_c2_g1_i1.p1 TRINITY_DN6736_c2_g1~~TRINITY_DN6736_c2_g1_i1.p1  ORF type:complete len:558 (+),score=125.49 TRINITY_DN6736_c2_g1_i1:89-1762(+)